MNTGYKNHVSERESSFLLMDEDFHTIVSFSNCSDVNFMGKASVSIRARMVL